MTAKMTTHNSMHQIAADVFPQAMSDILREDTLSSGFL
jgi:hypothetical protein